jgi:hypothetical protein
MIAAIFGIIVLVFFAIQIYRGIFHDTRKNTSLISWYKYLGGIGYF